MKPLHPHQTIRLGLIVLLLCLVVGGAVSPVDAQDPGLPGEVVLADLQTPRGIAFDGAGNLIVSVTGNGGETALTVPGIEDPTVPMEIKAGLSGAVLSVSSDGKSTPLIQGLPSYAAPTETVGLYRAIPKGESLWLLYTSLGSGFFWGDSIVELDAKTLAVKRVINLTPFEAANNPDGNEIDSNVADIAWTADGTLLIADAGANALLSWTEKDGLAVVTAWKENSVPTSVEVAANGDVYVGFLGEGLAPGAGKIEHWSGGALKETFPGLNAVTDILLDGDKLYAVELFLITEQGPGPGRVVMVDANGSTPVAEGLPAPFGIAKGPDNALYVSFGTIAFQPGMTGGVIKLK